MPRAYGEKFLRELAVTEPTTIGIEMAKACVEARLPAIYVAKALNVSRMSLYSWFRGKTIASKFHARIEDFTSNVNHDLKRGTLPAKNLEEVHRYLAQITGATPE
jgi:hypothetical protein